jgi:small conductance mechanosensitive channel
VKTLSEAQWRVGRELRRRLTEALQTAGINEHLSAGRIYVRPPQPRQDATDPFDNGVGGPT